jgi:hypothetical protein
LKETSEGDGEAATSRNEPSAGSVFSSSSIHQSIFHPNQDEEDAREVRPMARTPIVTITLTDDILRNYGNQLGALGEAEGFKALARAVNRVTNTVYGRVIRQVAKQSSIPTAVVRRSIKKQLVSPNINHGGALEGVITATGNPLSLRVFNPKQFSWGVRVKVWGRVQRFPGTFIYAGTYRSGQYVGSGHVFHRLTRESKPIEELFGPSVPEEMVRDESAKLFDATVQLMLPVRVAHEIGRLLPA